MAKPPNIEIMHEKKKAAVPVWLTVRAKMSMSPADRQTIGFGIRGETDGFVFWLSSTEPLLAFSPALTSSAGSERC